MEHGAWLTGSLIYLAAAVIAVPLARFLKLGSIIGYLAAGILIGPWGLKLVTRPEDILEFAELGVVLMLFLVGLELEPQRLWSLRKPIFGWGSVQLFGSALLIALVALACGVEWRLAVVAALGLAMSSTAIGLGVLAERNVMGTTSGEAILSVALLQDIAAIPSSSADPNSWRLPQPKMGLRSDQSRCGSSSRPTRKSIRTTPNSANCSMSSGRVTSFSPHGPIRMPAPR